MQTSNDALVTKVYASSLGYFKDEYCSLFLKNKRKMYPIINRGTWARVMSYRFMIQKFVNTFKDDQIQILSLGAGYDTVYFWLHDVMGEDINRVKVVEVDYRDVTEQKIQVIKKHEQLFSKIVNNEDEAKLLASSTLNFNLQQYSLIDQDLKKVDELKKKILDSGLLTDRPTLILTECLLVYMNLQDQSAILKMISGLVTGYVGLLNFEMINPKDKFGQMMLENIQDRGCKLQGVLDVPDMETQFKRFQDAGLVETEGYTMDKMYQEKLPGDERARIEKLEMFDEFEEWQMLQGHYCFILAQRSQGLKLQIQ